ncbi:MAG: glycosyltransferase family 2 protein, partial [Mariprofundales bacterium]|nr:glycosyltransferase family 2 protein [Mariprofundales bacterium]
MDGQMRLSIVIPAFNEAERLPQTLVDACAWLDTRLAAGDLFVDYDLLVVDDGSSDDTVVRAQDFFTHHGRGQVLAQPKNQGKGAAVRAGMLAATGDIRLFMDADNSTRIDELAKAWPLLIAGADVVIGSRQHEASDIAQHQSWLRESMGKCFNRMMHTMTGIALRDTQCGFKVFTAKAAQTLCSQQKAVGFGFDVELLYLAQRAGMRIEEIPVRWVNAPNSRVRMLIDPLQMA